MSTANFGAILDQSPEDIKAPPLMPVGTYLWVIQGLPRMDKSSQKKTEFVEYTCKCLQAMDDVDADELEAIGGIIDKTTKLTFYLTPDSTFMLKNFLFNDLKLEEEETMRPSVEKAMGNQFLGKIKHEPSQDGQRMFARIGSTAPTE